MKKILNLLILSLIFVQLFLPLYSFADEETEYKIHITESNSDLIAAIEGAKNSVTRLGPNERVLWKDSKGYLGAVLTNERFYVVSTTAGSWKKFRLKPQEAQNATASLSPFIAILVTGDRAVCYNISINGFFEVGLPVRTKLIAAEAGKHVAVVATNDKLIGIRKSSSSFTEIRIESGEVVKDIDVTSNKVVVRTSDRLLSFVADDPEWMEYELN